MKLEIKTELKFTSMDFKRTKTSDVIIKTEGISYRQKEYTESTPYSYGGLCRYHKYHRTLCIIFISDKDF